MDFFENADASALFEDYDEDLDDFVDDMILDNSLIQPLMAADPLPSLSEVTKGDFCVIENFKDDAEAFEDLNAIEDSGDEESLFSRKKKKVC